VGVNHVRQGKAHATWFLRAVMMSMLAHLTVGFCLLPLASCVRTLHIDNIRLPVEEGYKYVCFGTCRIAALEPEP
jgi:hypothetical protein